MEKKNKKEGHKFPKDRDKNCKTAPTEIAQKHGREACIYIYLSLSLFMESAWEFGLYELFNTSQHSRV